MVKNMAVRDLDFYYTPYLWFKLEISGIKSDTGDIQIWFGQRCATQTSKPIPIFMVILAKSYQFLGIFHEK